MTTMTANYLIEAIREAESLEELQRMVGPSENDETLNRQRLAKIDQLWEKSQKENWPSSIDLWPYPYGERYKQLNAEQAEFESRYC
ncbi:hypothetical protein [Endozoicomonas lisbonensis]|uniref:hypothetical protein n=1 Tax=Endozoicomonas lisbonensis TaxID=3120522 RepID=UPI0033930A0E